jgi:Tol biopolymer transport system component
MLHWLPTRPDTHIVHNDLDGVRLVSRLINVDKGETERTYDRPIAAMSHKGDTACNLNYARMFRRRRVVGYAGAGDPTEGVLHPEDDGLFVMDLKSGESRLIVSMAAIISEFEHPEEMGRRPIWFNHVGFSPDDSRIFFLARYTEGGTSGPLNSAMFTVAQDGSDLRKVVDYGQRMSHFEWKNNTEIVVTIERESLGRAFVLFTDGEDDHRLMDKQLIEDGHMTYSPDRRWLLSDIGPRSHPESMSTLRLYDTRTTELHILGEYHTPEPYRGDIRCDLHPRWNHLGNKISFDSIHKGTRQVYTMDLDLPH